MRRPRKRYLPVATTVSTSSVVQEFQEEKQRKILFRVLKKGQDGEGREYLFCEEENQYQ